MITLVSLLSLGLAAVAQAPSDTAIVRGVVFDSLTARRLAGASVQFVRVDPGHANDHFAASTDSTGAFTIRAVPAGRYLAGFYHAALDSLGFELPDRVVDVTASTKPIVLATPSPSTVIRTFCAAATGVDSAGALAPTLLFGFVRDARTQSGVENATVAVTWAAPRATANGLDIVEQHGDAISRHGGLFALCGAPADVTLSVHVARAGDSTTIDARLPASGLLHLTLAVGAAGATGRVAGHVFDRAKRPVANARVAIGDHEVSVNDAGSFTFGDVATGSRTVNVRALGYAPLSTIVNVVEGSPTSVDVALERVVALPAMVSRDSVASAHLEQFLADRRSVTVDSRFVEQTRLPGYKAAITVCQLVSSASGTGYCSRSCPAIVLNGHWTMLGMTDIDPDDVIGVEYFPGRPPSKYEGEFRKRPRPCPFIVWTRCPGSGVPTCGDNPASKSIDRPKDSDVAALGLTPTRSLPAAWSSRRRRHD